MWSRAARAGLKQILLGLVLIGAGCAAMANLLCAVLYGAVFISVPRSLDWVHFDASPIGFVLSVAMSLAAAPFFLLMGIVGIKGARDERRFLERLYTDRPRYEDESRTWVHRP